MQGLLVVLSCGYYPVHYLKHGQRVKIGGLTLAPTPLALRGLRAWAQCGVDARLDAFVLIDEVREKDHGAINVVAKTISHV